MHSLPTPLLASMGASKKPHRLVKVNGEIPHWTQRRAGEGKRRASAGALPSSTRDRTRPFGRSSKRPISNIITLIVPKNTILPMNSHRLYVTVLVGRATRPNLYHISNLTRSGSRGRADPLGLEQGIRLRIAFFLGGHFFGGTRGNRLRAWCVVLRCVPKR